MQTKMIRVSFLLLMIVVLSCPDAEKNAVELEVDFNWNPPCSGLLMSPEITLGNVPEGTVQFYVEMTDLDMPAFDHGSGFAKYENTNTIPAGAVRGSYAGPSPPYGIIHTYEIKVRALGENKALLGVGTMQRRYPPEGEEEVRWTPCNERNKKQSFQ